MSILKVATALYNPDLVKLTIPDKLSIDIPSVIAPAPMFPAKYPVESLPIFYISSLIVMNTLNYQFWSYQDGKMVRYEHKGAVGSTAMGNCFWAAWQDAIPDDCRGEHVDVLYSLSKTIQNFRDRINKKGIKDIFGDIPDPWSRKKVLDEVMSITELIYLAMMIYKQLKEDEFDGYGAAVRLSKVFPAGYDDLFLKKAQLTLMLASSEFRYRNPTARNNLSVTIAADYQIPRVLRCMGLLEYSNSVAALVDGEQLIKAGSPEENAIRAATVLAGEQISKQTGLAVAQLDWWLWSNRKGWPEAKFHLTETTDY